jgi:hypothetical protein
MDPVKKRRRRFVEQIIEVDAVHMIMMMETLG